GPGPRWVVTGLARANLPLVGPDLQRIGPAVVQRPAQLADARLVAGLHSPALKPLVVSLAAWPAETGQFACQRPNLCNVLHGVGPVQIGAHVVQGTQCP